MSENETEGGGGLGAKVLKVLLWVLTVGAAVGIGLAGGTKFTSSAMWIGLFTLWSYPVWFVYVIGALELSGAVLLLVPRFATYAAVLLGVIMTGAVGTLLMNPGELGATPAIGNLVALAIIGFSRRGVRWQPGS